MAKTLIIEGEASPVPIFSKELAYFKDWDFIHNTETGKNESCLTVWITTASFGSEGKLQAVRSQWWISDTEQKAALHFEAPSRFEVYDGRKFSRWVYIEHSEVPATHKRILAEWLRARWGLKKMRGRIR